MIFTRSRFFINLLALKQQELEEIYIFQTVMVSHIVTIGIIKIILLDINKIDGYLTRHLKIPMKSKEVVKSLFCRMITNNIKKKRKYSKTVFLVKCGCLVIYDKDIEKILKINKEETQYYQNYGWNLLGTPEELMVCWLIISNFIFKIIFFRNQSTHHDNNILLKIILIFFCANYQTLSILSNIFDFAI